MAAIKQGGIKKIVIIDDAFDPPVVGNMDAGEFSDFLTDIKFQETRSQAGISSEETADAISALMESEYDSDAVTTVIAKLYAKFIEEFDSRFDPSGRFSVLKGSNLYKILPLVKLLNKCSDIEIVRIGSNENIQMTVAGAHVVFIDYYLAPSFTPDSNPDSAEGRAARAESLMFLKKVLDVQQPGTGPSIMLMSSHHVVKDKSDEFRRDARDIKEPIFASRFHFMAKDDLTVGDDDVIEIKHDATNALLDIAQCHIFSGAIEDALIHWKNGVDSAIADVWKNITELELKDFAYLSRFRLAEEGQSLSSYLEWFFGEVIVDAIARKVDWSKPSFMILDQSALKSTPGSQIEGAFDGSTEKIAELYYRARVDERKEREGKDLRLGDVYSSSKENEVLAVLTPDCDLVRRKDRRAAPRLTVVAGTIQPLNAPDSSIADFIKKGNIPYNIVWDTKDVRTVEYDTIGAEGNVQLLGTLRPLYAQELQRRVLNEFARVGVAVAPAMAVTAKAEGVVRGVNGSIPLPLSKPDQASCAVIPKRGGSDRPRIIYHRSFVQEMLEQLELLKKRTQVTTREKVVLDPDVTRQLDTLLEPKNQTSFFEKLCRLGHQDKECTDGVVSTLRTAQTGKNAPWCQIVVTFNVPNEAGGHD